LRLEFRESFNEQIFEIYGLKLEEYYNREMKCTPFKKEEIIDY